MPHQGSGVAAGHGQRNTDVVNVFCEVSDHVLLGKIEMAATKKKSTHEHSHVQLSLFRFAEKSQNTIQAFGAVKSMEPL